MENSLDGLYDASCSGRSATFCRGKDQGSSFQGDPPVSVGPAAGKWQNMQSYSFSRWASSLCSQVLGSRTSFGSFLRSTLSVTRLQPSMSTQALFPLPVPKLGAFKNYKCGSRERKKRAFDRAFHVCVMAFNFWHADYKRIPISSIARTPNDAQQEALMNLKRMLRAFGSSEEEFSVPKSGRRITSLISMLSDLSEFVTWEGLGGDIYSGVYPGSQEGYRTVVEVPRDLDRADELRPYRTLDPSRLTLSGKAEWDPQEYLSDKLWMAFNEPESLRWTASVATDDVPNLSKEKYHMVKDLALLWDVNGLLYIHEPAEEGMELSMRFFNCYKNKETDRMAGLPTGQALLDLECRLPDQRISICASDRKDFYHQLRVHPKRAITNKLFPLLDITDLNGTQAFQKWCLRHDSKKKRYDRLREGDFLGRDPRQAKGGAPPRLVHACFASVPQGDHLGVEFATESHRNFLYGHGLLDSSSELRSGKPFYGTDLATGLVIDDYYAVSFEYADCPLWRPREDVSALPSSKAAKRLKEANEAYTQAGLLGSPNKDITDEEKACIMGAEILQHGGLA